jgi:hypothetical protein
MATYDWNKLNKTKLYKSIIAEWEAMLKNTDLKEQDYHAFLFKNPAIFLASYDSYLTISKLKLGTDFETDFVIVKEGYSDGTKYELIEIESPHSKLFDSKGKPTAKFNSALQQIRDWKRHLINNKSFFKKTFPTSSTRVISDSKLHFKIIIGHREDDQDVLAKRRQISEQENIDIISFDRLAEEASHKFFHEETMISSGQMRDIDFQKKNELGNPFYQCITDSEWRKICNRGHSHFYSNMLDSILSIRSYNDYFEQFKREHL